MPETQNDESLRFLMQGSLQGWQALPRFNQRDELTAQNDTCIIYGGERVVIPAKLPQVMKQNDHPSHIGREYMFWSGMSAEMKQLVSSCD